jgi:hypothetical protein
VAKSNRRLEGTSNEQKENIRKVVRAGLTFDFLDNILSQNG